MSTVVKQLSGAVAGRRVGSGYWPRGGEDLLGFIAGEFPAFTESFGETVDRVQVGADQIVGALAQAAQVAAGFAQATASVL